MLATIIISILAFAAAEAGSALSQNTRKRAQTLANKLADKMGANSTELQRLEQAYSDKDYALASEILSSSPMGSAFRKLKQEVTSNRSSIQAAREQHNRENQKLQNDINMLQQHGNDPSLVGSIIDSAQLDRLETSINDLTNGGISK